MTDKLIQKIQNFGIPKSKKDIRKFIGLTQFVNFMLPRYGKVSGVLTDVVALPRFQWSPTCMEVALLIKAMCTKGRMVSFPDYNKPFENFVDASGIAAAAVLVQKRDDNTNESKESIIEDLSDYKIVLVVLPESLSSDEKGSLRFICFTQEDENIYPGSGKRGCVDPS